MAPPLCFLPAERVGGFLLQEVQAEGLGTWTQSTAEGGGAILATGIKWKSANQWWDNLPPLQTLSSTQLQEHWQPVLYFLNRRSVDSSPGKLTSLEKWLIDFGYPMSGFQANHHHLKALTYKHRTPSYTVNTLLTVNVYAGGKPRTQNRVQTNKKKRENRK